MSLRIVGLPTQIGEVGRCPALKRPFSLFLGNGVDFVVRAQAASGVGSESGFGITMGCLVMPVTSSRSSLQYTQAGSEQ